MPASVFIQLWEESEAGWGVRPDGYSLALTAAELQTHIALMEQQQTDFFKSRGVTGVPNEYTRKRGRIHERIVDTATHEKLLAAPGHAIRGFGSLEEVALEDWQISVMKHLSSSEVNIDPDLDMIKQFRDCVIGDIELRDWLTSRHTNSTAIEAVIRENRI